MSSHTLAHPTEHRGTLHVGCLRFSDVPQSTFVQVTLPDGVRTDWGSFAIKLEHAESLGSLIQDELEDGYPVVFAAPVVGLDAANRPEEYEGILMLSHYNVSDEWGAQRPCVELTLEVCLSTFRIMIDPAFAYMFSEWMTKTVANIRMRLLELLELKNEDQ